MRARIVVAALLGALALTLSPGAASAAVGRDFYGVVPINPLSGSDIARMGAAKVGTLRLQVFWPSVEPSPDSYDFSYLDSVISQAAENGITVLPYVYGTPAWVGVDCGGLSASQCERVPPVGSQQEKDAWKDLLGELAARYGQGGTLWQSAGLPNQPIEDWQVWNEPSSPTYFQPKPSTNQYGALVKASHDAITSVDNGADIVLAGLFATPQGDANSKNVMWRYLGRLFKVEGIKKAIDSIALHPYSPDLAGIEFQVEKALDKLQDSGQKRTGIMITEIGWGSNPPTKDKPLIKGENGQRKMLEKSFKLLRDMRRKWNIERIVWYAWQDPGFELDGCSFCSSAGLFEEDGSAKPSWNEFVNFTGGSP